MLIKACIRSGIPGVMEPLRWIRGLTSNTYPMKSRHRLKFHLPWHFSGLTPLSDLFHHGCRRRRNGSAGTYHRLRRPMSTFRLLFLWVQAEDASFVYNVVVGAQKREKVSGRRWNCLGIRPGQSAVVHMYFGTKMLPGIRGAT